MVFFLNYFVDPAKCQIFGNASAEKCIPVLRVRHIKKTLSKEQCRIEVGRLVSHSLTQMCQQDCYFKFAMDPIALIYSCSHLSAKAKKVGK